MSKFLGFTERSMVVEKIYIGPPKMETIIGNKLLLPSNHIKLNFYIGGLKSGRIKFL